MARRLNCLSRVCSCPTPVWRQLQAGLANAAKLWRPTRLVELLSLSLKIIAKFWLENQGDRIRLKGFKVNRLVTCFMDTVGKQAEEKRWVNMEVMMMVMMMMMMMMVRYNLAGWSQLLKCASPIFHPQHQVRTLISIIIVVSLILPMMMMIKVKIRWFARSLAGFFL